MCATSRMIVKRKGAAAADRGALHAAALRCRPSRWAQTLAEAAQADGGMFDQGRVKLCHPHCAKFCVLGGGSCS